MVRSFIRLIILFILMILAEDLKSTILLLETAILTNTDLES
jgi:hypothetical protein